MLKFDTWVVKLGGAMLHSAELAHWVSACAQADNAVHTVIVAGGGRLANEVRSLYERWGLSEQLAHDLAINAMAINARVLGELMPVATRFSELSPSIVSASRPGAWIWYPEAGQDALGLTEDWSVTSDTIALRVAERLKAERLVLVKSVDRKMLHAASADYWTDQGLIDDAFPSVLSNSTVNAAIASKLDHGAFAAALRSADRFGFEVRRSRVL